LLHRALMETGRCALGRWAARGKQYIVMIRPVAEGLVMQQLLYADEVRSIREVEIPDTEVKPAELKLATQLIEQQSVDKFDPTEYVDDVRARVEKAIEGKVQGQEIVMQEEQPAGAQVIDLMEALRASLERKGPAKAKSSPAPVPVAESRKPPKRKEAAEPVAVATTTRKAAKKL